METGSPADALHLPAVSDVPAPPVVQPDGEPVVLQGSFAEGDAKSYRVLPFDVAGGVARIEVSYTWEPAPGTVLDLAIWDEHGYRDAAGFRGWSGSRQGIVHEGHRPVFVEAHAADRSFRPGAIGAGRWHVELGAGAVGNGGARFRVEVRAKSAPKGPGLGGDPGSGVPDRVDAEHVARAGPGWFHADLHQHGHHSHPRAPDWPELVGHSRAAGLDVLPFIEYVVERHWDELGAVQRANPDLLVYPGREVITYFGHVVVLGETPGFVEYRHGFEDVRLGDVQRAAADHGALFSVAHPTIYPEDEWGSYCRGCYFSLGAEIDWGAVDLLEVVTGSSYFERANLENPFVDTAIDLWHDRLRSGHRITAVAGSDDKLGALYGSAATTIGADELSRRAVRAALVGGRAYVRARGVARSPELDLTVTTDNGPSRTFGASLEATSAELEVTVRGARGQRLVLLADGVTVEEHALDRDDVTHRRRLDAQRGSGPLGTFFGVEVRDDHGLTALANPVFLRPTVPTG
jgi:hypothetical protein